MGCQDFPSCLRQIRPFPRLRWPSRRTPVSGSDSLKRRHGVDVRRGRIVGAVEAITRQLRLQSCSLSLAKAKVGNDDNKEWME